MSQNHDANPPRAESWMQRFRVSPQERLASAPIAPPPDNPDSIEFLDPRHLMKTGAIVTVSFVVGFLGWAAFAPLASAVISSGTVVVESHRKTIQHLEGGIIRQVLVEEGDKVAAGQPLVRLDNTQAGASLSLLQGQIDALAAQEARLVAERDGRNAVQFPAALKTRMTDTRVAEAVGGEESAFKNRARRWRARSPS